MSASLNRHALPLPLEIMTSFVSTDPALASRRAYRDTNRAPRRTHRLRAAIAIGLGVATGLAAGTTPALASQGPARLAASPEIVTPVAPINTDILATVDNSPASEVFDAAEAAIADAAAARDEVTASGLTVTVPAPDSSPLSTALVDHAEVRTLPRQLVLGVTDHITAETTELAAETATYRAGLADAQAKHDAEVLAAQQAAEAAAAAAAQAAAEALAAANTPEGAKATARELASSLYGWGDSQFSCLESLWTKESGWNYQAYNPSGAYGIPQSLPGDKMASVADDWETNATTQITWGLQYINGTYGTPCAAWGHSQATNWY